MKMSFSNTQNIRFRPQASLKTISGNASYNQFRESSERNKHFKVSNLLQ